MNSGVAALCCPMFFEVALFWAQKKAPFFTSLHHQEILLFIRQILFNWLQYLKVETFASKKKRPKSVKMDNEIQIFGEICVF
jgi:hypothetical protein